MGLWKPGASGHYSALPSWKCSNVCSAYYRVGKHAFKLFGELLCGVGFCILQKWTFTSTFIVLV